MSKSDIDQLKERLENIHLDAIKIPNNTLYDDFFEKIYRLLKVLNFLTVGIKKLSSSRLKLKKSQAEIENLRMKIAEFKGKIELLNSLKSKIKKVNKNEVTLYPSVDIQGSQDGSNQLHQEVSFYLT